MSDVCTCPSYDCATCTEPVPDGALLAQLVDTKRMLDLRERQLADCTRAMREVSEGVKDHARALDLAWPLLRTQNANISRELDFMARQLNVLAQKLDDARAGKSTGES